MRHKARKRDGFSCIICGDGEEDIGRMPDVHHVIPMRDFENKDDAHYLENLITLCPTHHNKWEGLYLKPQVIDKHG